VYRIIFYRDAKDNQPIKEYITQLADNTDKDSRIKLNKIDYYLQALREHGTRAGEPFVKHIDGDIWELRPLRDRIFFLLAGRQVCTSSPFCKENKQNPASGD